MSRLNSSDNSSHDPSVRRTIRRVPAHSDTQRSLQEASDALENAFDHIRHVRRNLLRLAETFPEPSTTGSSNGENGEQDSVNPGHEALVLSGDSTEEREPAVSNAPTGTQGVDGATSISQRSTSPNRPIQTIVVDPPSLNQAPLPTILPPRFSRPNLYGLSMHNPDSSATTHGLRVAAREAANAIDNSPGDVLGVARREFRYASEYEQVLSRRRRELGVVQDPQFSEDFRFRPDPSNRLNYLPLPPVPPPRRMQMPLSNLPARPRPITSYTVGPIDEYVTENQDLTEDQFISWLFPSQEYATSFVPRRDPHNPDTIRITRSNEPTSPLPEPQPRRRGWARLDPDGDEIPWDEEQGLERSRTDYRMRVLQRSREDSNDPAILRHDGRTFHGSVLDSMLSVPATRPRTDQWRSPTSNTSSRPFCVDPLPMPLSSMITKEHQNDYHPDVIVPRHESLAGR